MGTTNRPPAGTGKAVVIGRNQQHQYTIDNQAPAIAQRLQLRPSGKRQWQGNCPACGYSNSLNLTEREGKPLWHCHACGDAGAIRAYLNKAYHTPLMPVRVASGPRLSPNRMAFIQRLWQRSLPAENTVIERYLAQRGLVGPIPPTLRYLPNAMHTPTGKRFMVMLSGVSVWPSRTVTAIHRTYIRPDGSGKIEHPQARMMLGHNNGGAVRLAPHTNRLGIAEGIETALSVQQATGLPMWACLSTSGLQNVIVPDEVREITICADNDPPGLKAARAIARQLKMQGKTVRLAIPPQQGTDFNDIIKEAGHE